MPKVINHAEDGKVVAHSVSSFVTDHLFDTAGQIYYGDPVPIERKIDRLANAFGDLVGMLHEKKVITDDEVFRDIIGYFSHRLEVVDDE